MTSSKSDNDFSFSLLDDDPKGGWGLGEVKSSETPMAIVKCFPTMNKGSDFREQKAQIK